MKKSLITKLLKWLLGSVFVIVFIILSWNSFVIQQIISETADNNLKSVAQVNARSVENLLSNFQEATMSIAGQLEEIQPYARGMVSTAFVKSYLSQNPAAVNVWVEFVEWEAYGGLNAGTELASVYRIPKEYNGFLDLYVYRKGSQIIEETTFDSDYIDYDYFKEVQEKNVPYVMAPYVDDYTQMVVASVVAPIQDKYGKFLGCVGIDFDETSIANIEFKKGAFESSYSYILTNEGIILSHSESEDLIGQDVSALGTQEGYRLYEASIYLGEDIPSWTAVTTVSQAELTSNSTEASMASAAISTILQLLLGFIIYKIIKKTLRPIHTIGKAAEDLSLGNLSTEIVYTSNDELGGLAETFRKMSNILKLYMNEISRVLNEISTNNLTGTIHEEYIGDFSQIKESLEIIQKELSHSIYQISLAADEVAIGSEQLSSGAQTLAEGAAEQTEYIENLTGSVEQVSHLAAQNEEHAKGAHKFSIETNTCIEVCNREMNQMLEAMNDIKMQSNEISNIIKTVEEIASQTNLLALNAAIEAARAGQSGKGFAVVATEVSNLASQSTVAAKNTSELIERSVISVQKGMEIANATAKTLQEITQATGETKEQINEILEKTEQQKIAFSNMSNEVHKISQVIQNNSAASQEDAAYAQQLSAQAAMLKELVKRFQLKEQDFSEKE